MESDVAKQEMVFLRDVAFQSCLYVNSFLESQVLLIEDDLTSNRDDIYLKVKFLRKSIVSFIHVMLYNVVYISCNRSTFLISVFLRHMIQTDALLNQSLIG